MYEAQKPDTKQGDFVQLVQNDAKFLDMVINEEEIKSMTKQEIPKDFQK